MLFHIKSDRVGEC